MSTHATIGIKFPDGTVQGCYVHYDGGSMAPRIIDYLQKNTTTGLVVLITEAQARGGIRSFHHPPLGALLGGDDSPITDFLDNNGPYIIDETNWGHDHMGAEYEYLVDYKTGVIWMEVGNA